MILGLITFSGCIVVDVVSIAGFVIEKQEGYNCIFGNVSSFSFDFLSVL